MKPNFGLSVISQGLFYLRRTQTNLDQVIFPILQHEVDQWNLLTDSISIHSRLLLVKDHLEPLYEPIRTKLAQALQNFITKHICI